MNGIHEVTGSIPVWSTILRFRLLTRACASVGTLQDEGLLRIEEDSWEGANIAASRQEDRR